MSSSGQSSRPSLANHRAGLATRLQERRPEIEEAILDRASAVSDPSAVAHVDYVQGLRSAIAAAVGYALACIEHGEERCGPVPAAMLTQAAQAAHNRVGLQIVLRRYTAGYSALGDFLIQETGQMGAKVPISLLHRLQRELTAVFDRLLAAVSAEYERHADHRFSPSLRRLERLKCLLAAEQIDTDDFPYDFDDWHVGAIATGPGATGLVSDLATALDRRLLSVAPAKHTIWAWFGGRHRLDPTDLSASISTPWPADVSLALGEPARGLSGWRLTHRQAQGARAVAIRDPRPITRYADIALLATALRDDDLVSFLTETMIAPLNDARDGGATLRQTLRAYFSAGRNVTAAAAALKVDRSTVHNRVRESEDRLCYSLHQCQTELDIALRLEDLTGHHIGRFGSA